MFLVSNVFSVDVAGLQGRLNPAPSQLGGTYRLVAAPALPGLRRHRGRGVRGLVALVSGVRSVPPLPRRIAAEPDTAVTGRGFGSALAITVTLALAVFLASMAVLVSLMHPHLAGLGAFAGAVNQQNQTAKSLLYLLAFVVILPLALLLVPRLADAIARDRTARPCRCSPRCRWPLWPGS